MRVKKEKTRMIRTQIQLTDEQAAGLKNLSAEKGGSMAEWIRKAVDRLILEVGEPSWEERKKRALAAVGVGRSDLSDVAENHDAYLAEAYDHSKK
jgi:hypothetical protein